MIPLLTKFDISKSILKNNQTIYDFNTSASV